MTKGPMSAEDELCARAKALIDQGYQCADEAQLQALMRQAYQLLVPLIATEFPKALYLHACCTLRFEGLEEEAQEERYISLIQRAAQAGDARAQFRLGQMYEPDSDLEADPAASAYWFEMSALQGYAYAQWVHGLNLWTGHGRPRDEALGLDFINRAAEGRFEGAIQFLADAYSAGSQGYPKDEAQAELWRQRLKEPGLLRY